MDDGDKSNRDDKTLDVHGIFKTDGSLQAEVDSAMTASRSDRTGRSARVRG